jgi:hypothetical protein
MEAKQQEMNSNEGWLTKKGAKVKNWKRRWFVLENEEMRYYTSQDKKKPPKGKFFVKGIKFSFVTLAEEKRISNCFQAKTPTRTYFMYSDTAEELKIWKEKLVSSGAIWENTDGTADSLEIRATLKQPQQPNNPSPQSPQSSFQSSSPLSPSPSSPQSPPLQSSSSQSSPKPDESKPKDAVQKREEEEMDEAKVKELESVLDSTIDDLKNFTTNSGPQVPKSKNYRHDDDETSFLTSLQNQIQKEI